MDHSFIHPVPARTGSISLANRPAAVLALFVLASAGALLPVLATDVLPLLDLNSHETRLYALWSILVAGVGSRFYAVDTLVLPNMGFDLVGLSLSRWMDVAAAGRLYFAAVLLLTLGGVAVLGRVLHGRWSAVQLVSVLLLYVLHTVLGFLGYALGIALLFWVLAARLSLERRPVPARLLVGSLACVVLLVCHVAAFATYAVVLAGVGMDMLLRRPFGQGLARLRLVALMALEGLPAGILFLLMARNGDGEGGYQYFHPVWRSKLEGLLPSLSAGNLVADGATLVGLVVLAALLGSVVQGGGRVRLARPLLPGLGMLGLLYFVLPPNVGTGSFVDQRIPAVALLLAVAALQVRVAVPSRPVLALAAGLCAACLVKQVALAGSWRAASVPLGAVAAMVHRLPDGAVILQGECPSRMPGLTGAYADREPPLSHAIAVAGLDGRRFVPVTWTIRGQQAIRVVPEYARYKALQDRFNRPVCTVAQVEAMLSAGRALLAEQARSGGLVAPLFLNLVRLPPSGPLSAAAVDGTADMTVYAVMPP